mmetsp:Transcript_1948/g.5295  ORF Transcript_1948/g.5295 Transcript_1948/m.5295 type:complete len:100 (+) Transcript_1948:213-512(+)
MLRQSSESSDFLSDLTFIPAGVKVGNSGVRHGSAPPPSPLASRFLLDFLRPKTSQVDGVATILGVGGKDESLLLSWTGVVARGGDACALPRTGGDAWSL